MHRCLPGARVRALIVLCLLSAPLSGGTLSRKGAESFALAFFRRDTTLQSMFDGNTLAMSRRLGISYEGVQYKQLISYDVDDSTRASVNEGKLGYTVSLDTLAGGFARVLIDVAGGAQRREFYFRGKKCISPLEYFTRGWHVRESRHFRFVLSDPGLFNVYCVNTLETFLEQAAGRLGLSANDLHALARGKIDYYLCGSEEEVRSLTGFQVRGMYSLAYDAIVSTYGAHEHELTHLLVNYRLRRLPLYTHPFLQEGLAVALGGRGGLDGAVLAELAGFLYVSQSVETGSLLERAGFAQTDPSISYPAAGLYNRFLLGRLGTEAYLKLYRKHSGSAGSSAVARIDPGELPDSTGWVSYIAETTHRQAIGFDSAPPGARCVFSDGVSSVAGDGEKYYFRVLDHMLLPGSAHSSGYRSRLFRQLYPAEPYRGEEYLVRADSGEVSVYNLLTNSLIAHYAAGFAIPPAIVPRRGDGYGFSVRAGAFDGPLVPSSGGTWELIRSSDSDRYFHGLSFPDSLHGWAVGDSGTIIRTSDGGESWMQLQAGTSQNITCVSFTDSMHGLVGAAGNAIGRTTDGGFSWKWWQLPGGPRSVCTAIALLDAREGWSCDNMNGISHTGDGGNTWEPQPGPGSAFGIQFLSPREGWAIGARKVAFHTVNGGESWTSVYLDTLRCGRVFTLISTAVCAYDSCVWVGTTSAASNNSPARALVFASRDRGRTWHCQWYPGTGSFYAIRFVDTREGWAAANNGLLHTTDGGRLWTMHTPMSHLIMVGICFVDRTHGWCLTFGGDIYRFRPR